MKGNIMIILYLLLITSFNVGALQPKSWHTTEISNYCNYIYAPIVIDTSDNTHIAYTYRIVNDPYFHLNYAYWTGSKWDIQTVDNGQISKFSMALDSYNYPHIAYFDYSSVYLKYAYWNGKKWSIQDVDSNCRNDRIYLCLDSLNRPHIVYLSPKPDSYIKYAKWDGNKWDIQTLDSLGNNCQYISFILDSNDCPHICYQQQYSYNRYCVKHARLKDNEWDIQIIEDNTVIYSSSIDVDSKNYPHIVYYNVNNIPYLKYAHWTGTEWIIDKLVDSQGVVEQGAGLYCDIVIDSNDYPHISYSFYDNFKYTFSLKYAHWNGNEWEKVTVDETTNDVGKYNSIALDSKDEPRISYIERTNWILKYAWYGRSCVGIDLTSFTAKPNNDAITLNWSVTTDEDISGFNLYRRIITPTSVSPVRELAPPVLTDWSGKGMPGGIAHSPLQCEEGYVWTKVNTSLITGTNPYSYTDRGVLSDTTYEYKLEAVVSDNNETLGTTSATSGNGNPSSFEITRIYPTPASSEINVVVNIPANANIDISIYDISGRRVSTIASGLYNPGEYTLTCYISGLINGVYIIRMTTGELSASKNFVIAR